MTTTPEMQSDIEQRLRDALSARAELVQPHDLAPLTPVVELRPRWQTPSMPGLPSCGTPARTRPSWPSTA